MQNFYLYIIFILIREPHLIQSKMSFFGKMFGGKKDVAPTTGEAIQKLRDTEEMLGKKQDFLEKKVEAEMVLADFKDLNKNLPI